MHTDLLKTVGTLPRLTSLESNLRFTDGGPFQQFPALCNLQLEECGFSDLAFLGSLKSLETLRIFNLGSCDYRALTNLSTLNEVAIFAAAATDALPDFSMLSSLEKLTLTHRTPRRVVRQLTQAPLKSLKIKLSRGDLEILRGISTLTDLTLCAPVRRHHRLAGFSRLGRLSIEELCTTDLSFTTELPRLYSLTLGSEKKGPFDLRRLTRSLRNLCLRIPMSRIAGESCLRRMKNLSSLELWHVSVGDLGVLEKCPSLEELRLVEPDFDFGPFPDIPGLRVLSLLGGEGDLPECVLSRNALEELALVTPVSDLSPLSRLSKLKRLRIDPGPAQRFDFLRSLSELQSLRIGADTVDLSQLPVCKGVKSLSLNAACIHLEALARWPSLEVLEIRVGEEGLSPFAALTNLKGLRLSWEDADEIPNTKQDCEPLTRMTRLESLGLYSEY